MSIADIGVLDCDHRAVRAQAGMQLAVTDVDRDHLPCATGEQNMGESAGRGADVEADRAPGIEAEMIERGGKLHPAARDPGVGRLRAQHGVGGNLVGGLADRDIVGDDPAGRDGGLRLGPALEQAALDQQAIGAHALCHCPSKNMPACAGRGDWLRQD